MFELSHVLDEKWDYNRASYEVFIDFKKAYDSVRKEVLYCTLSKFGVPTKLSEMMEMSLY
jgi:sorting nexin-29